MKKHIILIVILLISLSAVISPAGNENYFRKGREYANNGEYNKALDYLGKAQQLNPGRASIYIARAVVYINMKMEYDAIEELNRAITLDSGKANAYYLLAMLYEEIGDKVNAMFAWKKYLNLKPRGGRSNAARERLKRLEGN